MKLVALRRLLALGQSGQGRQLGEAAMRRLGFRIDPPVSTSHLDAFDRQYGVETRGSLQWDELADGGDAAAFVTAYLGVRPDWARALIRHVDAADRTFVDFGCGKGTALVVASEFPFRAITGVEFSPQLCDVARRNAAVIADRFPGRPPISVVQSDAADFEFAGGRYTVFMYHPFLKPVMKRVVRNLDRALEAGAADEITVLYVNPQFAGTLDRSRLFRRSPPGLIDFEPGGRSGLRSQAGIWRTGGPAAGRGT